MANFAGYITNNGQSFGAVMSGDGKVGPAGPQGKDGKIGKNLEFEWQGTSLGVRQEGETEYKYTDLQGPQGKDGYDDTEIRKEISKKVDKVEGKELSSNDYTTEDKNKVAKISNDIANSLSEAKQYTDTEIAKFDFIKVVDVLPETGLPNRIYFVPKTDSETQNLFDEYAWINEQWEFITTKQIEVDLTPYATIEYVNNLVGDYETAMNELIEGAGV